MTRVGKHVRSRWIPSDSGGFWEVRDVDWSGWVGGLEPRARPRPAPCARFSVAGTRPRFTSWSVPVTLEPKEFGRPWHGRTVVEEHRTAPNYFREFLINQLDPFGSYEHLASLLPEDTLWVQSQYSAYREDRRLLVRLSTQQLWRKHVEMSVRDWAYNAIASIPGAYAHAEREQELILDLAHSNERTDES